MPDLYKHYNCPKWFRKRLAEAEELVDYSPFDWADYFDAAFREVKSKFGQTFAIQDEGDVPPNVLALKDAVDALPCSIKILELQVDTKKHKHVEDQICQLVSYDLSRLGERCTEYCGFIGADDAEGFNKFLAGKFGLVPSQTFAETFCHDLATTYFSDTDKPDIHFQFLFYNIRNQFERYVKDLLELIVVGPLNYQMVEKFKKEKVDYNALYGLKEDSILPMSKITEKDPTFGAFAKLSDGEARGITIEDLQKHVSTIQLIPKVPEAVKAVFARAKDLYIFGYFRYSFFTISSHYAYLALESAIKNRYAMSLGSKAILINRKGQLHEMTPSWERIHQFCWENRKQGWDARQVEVNGEAFPFSMSKLLDWLVSKKLIAKWERQQYDAGVHLRHALSHLESPSIFMPNPQALIIIAEKINNLYAHSVVPAA